MLNRLLIMTWALTSALAAASAAARDVPVDFDRWMYPFNASPGARTSGSTFGAVQNPAFDDLDAQILIGFDATAAGIPEGAGAGNYRIAAARVELTTATDRAFVLDSTYDAWSTYVDESTDDAGRPVELYGVGYRHGFTNAGLSGSTAEPGPPVFEEVEAFGAPGPPSPESRNAYASDYADGTARDVSNHVRQRFDPVPWALGSVEGLAPGDAVPIQATMHFDLDLTNSTVLQQLQQGLDQGKLFFAVASRHTSVQGSSEGIPSFHLGDATGASLGQRARLHLDYEIVPEPCAATLLAMALVLWPRRRRRGNH
jgi:hypothetical protein